MSAERLGIRSTKNESWVCGGRRTPLTKLKQLMAVHRTTTTGIVMNPFNEVVTLGKASDETMGGGFRFTEPDIGGTTGHSFG